MYTITELRNLSPKELENELKKAQLSLSQLKIQISTKHAKNTHAMAGHKQYVARIKTIMNMGKPTPPSN